MAELSAIVAILMVIAAVVVYWPELRQGTRIIWGTGTVWMAPVGTGLNETGWEELGYVDGPVLIQMSIQAQLTTTELEAFVRVFNDSYGLEDPNDK